MWSVVLVTCMLASHVSSVNVTEYLLKYGYLKSDDNSLRQINITDTLSIFQIQHKLPATGTINKETLEFMAKPRCGNKDVADFRIASTKWNKRNISWHYVQTTPEILSLTARAFGVWANHSGLTFYHDILTPDIVISNQKTFHNFALTNALCVNPFDGPGYALGHSYFPDNYEPVEIHIDSDEYWYLGLDSAPAGQFSLISVLIHEIGHALGLQHSDDESSAMFALYSGDSLRDLSPDDEIAIQYLYGPPLPTKTVELSPMDEPTFKNMDSPDLCNLNDINTFLILNQRMYIAHKNWIWTMNNGDNKYDKPVALTDLFMSIPSDFQNITAVYQRPSGEIVLVIKNQLYMYNFPSLTLVSGYPIPVYSLGLPQNVKIHAIVNTYSGRTFVFYDDMYYIELDECKFYTKDRGLISKAFPGVPPSMDGAFRYTNGRIYFFKDYNYYEFNEFTNKMVKADRNDLNLFGIQCPNKTILEQLKELLEKLAPTLRNMEN